MFLGVFIYWVFSVIFSGEEQSKFCLVWRQGPRVVSDSPHVPTNWQVFMGSVVIVMARAYGMGPLARAQSHQRYAGVLCERERAGCWSVASRTSTDLRKVGASRRVGSGACCASR